MSLELHELFIPRNRSFVDTASLFLRNKLSTHVPSQIFWLRSNIIHQHSSRIVRLVLFKSFWNVRCLGL